MTNVDRPYVYVERTIKPVHYDIPKIGSCVGLPKRLTKSERKAYNFRLRDSAMAGNDIYVDSAAELFELLKSRKVIAERNKRIYTAIIDFSQNAVAETWLCNYDEELFGHMQLQGCMGAQGTMVMPPMAGTTVDGEAFNELGQSYTTISHLGWLFKLFEDGTENTDYVDTTYMRIKLSFSQFGSSWVGAANYGKEMFGMMLPAEVEKAMVDNVRLLG